MNRYKVEVTKTPGNWYKWSVWLEWEAGWEWVADCGTRGYGGPSRCCREGWDKVAELQREDEANTATIATEAEAKDKNIGSDMFEAMGWKQAPEGTEAGIAVQITPHGDGTWNWVACTPAGDALGTGAETVKDALFFASEKAMEILEKPKPVEYPYSMVFGPWKELQDGPDYILVKMEPQWNRAPIYHIQHYNPEKEKWVTSWQLIDRASGLLTAMLERLNSDL